MICHSRDIHLAHILSRRKNTPHDRRWFRNLCICTGKMPPNEQRLSDAEPVLAGAKAARGFRDTFLNLTAGMAVAKLV